ncbi:MAG: hypothetical protein V1929_04750 [bacterium]
MTLALDNRGRPAQSGRFVLSVADQRRADYDAFIGFACLCHANPELSILANEEVFPPWPDTVKKRLAIKGASSPDHAANRKRDAVWARQIQRRTARERLPRNGHVVVGRACQCKARLTAPLLEDDAEAIRRHIVVRIQELDELPATKRKPAIPCESRSVRTHESDVMETKCGIFRRPLYPRSDNAIRVVRRTVINDEHFNGSVILFPCRADGFAKEFTSVMGGDDD